MRAPRTGGRQQRLSHKRDDKRLRDRLTVTNGQGRIFIGSMGERFVDKDVTRNLSQRGEHTIVIDTLSCEPGDQTIPRALGCHTNACEVIAVHALRTVPNSLSRLVA